MTLPLEPTIEPQLAKTGTELPPEGDWVYEPKWDGFRVIAFVDGDEIFLYRFSDDPVLLQGWTSDRQLISRALGRITPNGATALYDAVAAAIPRRMGGLLIAAGIEFFAADLLRRHVGDGADCGAGAGEHFTGGDRGASKDAHAFAHRSANGSAARSCGN